jgi:hypothetical protein
MKVFEARDSNLAGGESVACTNVRPRREGWYLAALTILATCPAAATPLTVSVDYRAPAGCPGKDVFVRRLLRRLPTVRVAIDAERRFEVVVESTPEGSTARLEFIDADGEHVERAIESRECNEAVSGIALVTALAIDPRLTITTTPDEKDPLVEQPTGATDTSAHVSDRRRQPARAEVRPRPRSDGEDRRSDDGDQDRDAWSGAMGATLGAVTDVAPVLSPGGALFAELGPGRRFRARLTAGYADSGEFDLAGGIARFRLGYGRTEICPLAVFADAIVLRPCAAVELGMLYATGLESPRIALSRASLEPWIAGIGGLRAAVGLGSVFAFSIEGQLRVPLLLRTYVFERPEQVAYETPGLGGGIFVGAEARLQ